MDLIWEELGHKFKDIIGMGKPGVIASIVAASQRLHTYDQKVFMWFCFIYFAVWISTIIFYSVLGNSYPLRELSLPSNFGINFLLDPNTVTSLPILWQCCQALVSAVSSTNESSDCVVPRFLFLDSYLFSKDKANWSWPRSLKMHVIGSLILQQVFRYPSVRNLQFTS